ncbi:ABC transporter permease [Glutamicibacter bergerei]|uniref:ABC transporter permease n=1 Tax=Glutamicibacter bergerei TaxID=256702 RepID=A0ABV9MMY1_9MICC|nr:ABC transporter permease [Glutamicibacter sp. BW77]PCC36059.1 sugar ABC transporter permease [Glutamicibacter sp. BW77]HBV10757.1 ABC transporter permease [Micrococcaceae bacterium]
MSFATSSHARSTVHNRPRRSVLKWLLDAGLRRNMGLIFALILLCVVGGLTAGERFADVNNMMTILRLAAVTGVVSIGATFVITIAGIDLSVGAILALAAVWATTLSGQMFAESTSWIFLPITAMAIGAAAGLVNGILIAYGKVVSFITTLAMMAAARGLAEIISDKKTQLISVDGFLQAIGGDLFGIPTIVLIFVLVAIGGWVLLNRTTFGRRTFAIGGNAEAARLAGIKVERHTMIVYALAGLCAGIGAFMLMARTTTGSATHGTGLELDVIAAVVIGGTLLTGGRGSIFGTVLGVLIFSTLTNIFALNNLSLSVQLVAKGAIIVIAVLIQRQLAIRQSRT